MPCNMDLLLVPEYLRTLQVSPQNKYAALPSSAHAGGRVLQSLSDDVEGNWTGGKQVCRQSSRGVGSAISAL